MEYTSKRAYSYYTMFRYFLNTERQGKDKILRVRL